MKRETFRKRVGRRRVKQAAVDYKGGRCIRCGYSKCLAALQFHHRDRAQKKYELSISQKTSLPSVMEELDKCDLLCANCHAEVEQNNYADIEELGCP